MRRPLWREKGTDIWKETRKALDGQRLATRRLVRGTSWLRTGGVADELVGRIYGDSGTAGDDPTELVLYTFPALFLLCLLLYGEG